MVDLTKISGIPETVILHKLVCKIWDTLTWSDDPGVHTLAQEGRQEVVLQNIT